MTQEEVVTTKEGTKMETHTIAARKTKGKKILSRIWSLFMLDGDGWMIVAFFGVTIAALLSTLLKR